ncbi:acyltransferase family protein [Actinacidiphila sp. ITFR-21]|uniref:acyltransferase family protein n=1 Tax=Actinacidiphila sp. ITFR-21 TaxID=3075199 RepID=UPI00288AE537|nr:acyltransferase [Streptomyces sp. ITFR-21]WNI17151.1 acyltransferase [Streptomyces sp. ITFR-21]
MRHAERSGADDWPPSPVTIPGGSGLLPPAQPAAPGRDSRDAATGAAATPTGRGTAVQTPPWDTHFPAPAPPPAAERPEPAPPEAPPPAPPPRRARLYVIDAVRLFAAVLVALHHFAGTKRANTAHNVIWDRPVSHIMPTVFRFAAYGWIGVEIFFVISGFVICMSCWGRRPRDFFVSRVIRLYPAYWFGVVFTTVVLTAFPGVWAKPTTRDALYNLSMLQSGSRIPNVDGVYWTLWSELRFYLIFLVVVAAGLTYRKVVVFCCVWGALAMLAPVSGLPFLVLLADPDGAWYFIAGLALFLMYRFGQDLLLWGILALSWLMAQDEIGRRIDQVEHVSSWRGALTVYTLFILFMVCVALGYTDRFQWKWLITAGSLTYPFYLIHYTAGTIAIHHLRDRADPRVLVAGLIVGGLVLSYLIHRLVERPVSKLLKRGLTNAFAHLGPMPSRKTAS